MFLTTFMIFWNKTEIATFVPSLLSPFGGCYAQDPSVHSHSPPVVSQPSVRKPPCRRSVRPEVHVRRPSVHAQEGAIPVRSKINAPLE